MNRIKEEMIKNAIKLGKNALTWIIQTPVIVGVCTLAIKYKKKKRLNGNIRWGKKIPDRILFLESVHLNLFREQFVGASTSTKGGDLEEHFLKAHEHKQAILLIKPLG